VEIFSIPENWRYRKAIRKAKEEGKINWLGSNTKKKGEGRAKGEELTSLKKGNPPHLILRRENAILLTTPSKVKKAP